MEKLSPQGKLTIYFMEEGDSIIAYSPALDLSTCGDTFEEAKANFEEALVLFFDECTKRGTLRDALESLGWHFDKPSRSLSPPKTIGHLDSVEFHKLGGPVTKGYIGPYQGQTEITSSDINALLAHGGMPFSEVITTIANLSQNVGVLTKDITILKDSVGTLKWVMGIGLAFIGLMVAFSTIIK